MKGRIFPFAFLAVAVVCAIVLLVQATPTGSKPKGGADLATRAPDHAATGHVSSAVGSSGDTLPASAGTSQALPTATTPASPQTSLKPPASPAVSPSTAGAGNFGSVRAFSVGRDSSAGKSGQEPQADVAERDRSGDETAGSSRSVADILANADLSIPGVQEEIARQLLAAEEAKRKEVLAKADQLGVPVRISKPNGGSMELAQFEGDTPIYRETHDLNAAISSGASQIQTAPYNLDGSGVLVGVWDAGAARSTHQEFTANGVSRVVIKNPTMPDSHASHVTGTVASAGIDSQAKGMAPKVRVDSYDWNSDIAEMTAAGAATAAAAGKLPVSNHSYGYVLNFFYQWLRGAYWDKTREVDAVARALPYYLPFWAAGNSQKQFLDKSGYETIWGESTAKNVVTIGAVNDAVSGGTRVPANGTIASFSSLGPCDDGRIKPDLVANGVGLKSITNTSDNLYFITSGTSMASPSASGSAALLVQHYANQFPGQAMRASTLKALLIHTADDLGRPGPDYMYGWGLINVRAAADLINSHKANLDKAQSEHG